MPLASTAAVLSVVPKAAGMLALVRIVVMAIPAPSAWIIAMALAAEFPGSSNRCVELGADYAVAATDVAVDHELFAGVQVFHKDADDTGELGHAALDQVFQERDVDQRRGGALLDDQFDRAPAGRVERGGDQGLAGLDVQPARRLPGLKG